MNAIRELLAIVQGTRYEQQIRQWCHTHVRTITHDSILEERAIMPANLVQEQTYMLRQQVALVVEDLVANHTQTTVKPSPIYGERRTITSRTICILIDTP